jgi:cytochrome c oxidase cbb3-type subunit 3
MKQKPEEDRLLDHSYDGIREYDNPMPRWWLLLFAVTIIFVPIYYLMPGDIGAGAQRDEVYAREMAAFKAEHPDFGKSTVTAEALAAIVSDPAQVAAGRAVFTTTCAACHQADGGGLIGPNLTDNSWIHGGTPMAVHAAITNGVLAKGMPAWGTLLKPEQINAVTAFVRSLQGTTPKSPKAAEGVVTNPDGTATDTTAASKKS